VRQLSDPLLEVILLRYYGEMSIAEVAETLQINPGTVKSRLFSATHKLKALLPEEMRE
jgi:RNA polymerase sigma-70 factor (ECF subfamily)